MRWWQPLLVLVALVLLMGTLLWLFDSLARIHAAAAALSPLLANLLLGLFIVLGLAIAAILIYYAWLFLRPRRHRLKPTPPRDRTAAAAANLEAIQQQVHQIQDDVARQALADESAQLAAAMDGRDWQITVFGVGSAGKTSLINRLLGEPAGAVAAPMGTTQAPQSYRLQISGLNRGLMLTDTPGIAEAGVAGTLREQDARQLATAADLLLFVVDDDLRQSEYGVLRSLLEMGKRVLVVLNKADRYPDPELELIVQRLRSRLMPLLAAADVIAIAADPPPLPMADGGWFQQEPDILPLLERLAAVLRSEGDGLIADNILLQSQRLSEAARQQIDTQRQAQANRIVERYQWIVAGVIAVTPLPGIDLLAAAAVNAQMVVELGRVYGCDITIEEGKQLAMSIAKTLAGLGIVKGSLELLALGLQMNVATVLAGRGLQGISGAYLTRIAGKSFIEYFRHSQDWGDGGMAAVVQEQFRLNQRDSFLKAFIQDALTQALPESLATALSNRPVDGHLPDSPQSQAD